MDLPFSFISFFLFLAFVLSLIKGLNKSNKAQKLPPSPWKLPFIGNMHHLIGSPPHQALRKLAQKHGALMHLQLGEIPFVVVTSPRVAKEVMKTHDQAFANHGEFLSAKIFSYDGLDIVCCQYGDYWRQMRKVCTLGLFTAKAVRSFRYVRQDDSLNLVSSIKALAGARKSIDLKDELFSYTSSMVCRAAFGKVSKDDRFALTQLIREVFLLSSFNFSAIFPSLKILHSLLSGKTKMLNIHHKLDKVLDKIIDQHIDNIAGKEIATGELEDEDLIDVLLRVKESGGLNFPLTNNNIKAVLNAGEFALGCHLVWPMLNFL